MSIEPLNAKFQALAGMLFVLMVMIFQVWIMPLLWRTSKPLVLLQNGIRKRVSFLEGQLLDRSVVITRDLVDKALVSWFRGKTMTETLNKSTRDAYGQRLWNLRSI